MPSRRKARWHFHLQETRRLLMIAEVVATHE